jgi:hypothetical protein
LGNFFVVVPRIGQAVEGKRLFWAGLDSARRIKSQSPSKVEESNWGCAASFARQNGSGFPVIADRSTGSWVLASGTWFHSSGYASGAESRLLRRYLEVEAVILARELEGFFVLIFGDGRTREVVVVTDIVGSCHCFWRSFPGAIALAGSSMLLASLAEIKLDWVGCQEFLQTGIIYEDRTCYQDVRKLGPASVFRYSGGAEKEERYWQAADLNPETLRNGAAVHTLWDRTMHAVNDIHRIYDKPVCDLTGGYDSRALVAAFVGAQIPCATTVSGPPDSADVTISTSLAQMLHLRHLHNESLQQISVDRIWAAVALTDGEYDSIEYAGVLEIHQRLAEQFEISINGSFGEVARGYWWELLFPRIGARVRLDSRGLAQRRYAAQRCDSSIIPVEHRLNLVDHFAAVIDRTNAGLFEFPNTFQMDHAYLMMRMQRWQGRIASSTNQLWPCLSPFMFRSILETMLETQSLLRWRSLLIRKMLAEFAPRLAKYPLEHGFPAQPASWKNVYQFAPLALHLGSKALVKCGLPGPAVAAGSHDRAVGLRLRLWRNEQFRELLRPASMKLSAWFDSLSLEEFLRRSQRENFPFGDQWARLLSLECALRANTGRQHSIG